MDTNYYIDALRSPKDERGAPIGFGATFRTWHKEHLSKIAMSAVVLHELLVGATNAQYRHRIVTEFVAPFRERERLLLPSLWAWERAAATDAALREKGSSYRALLEQRGFFNDILIALAAREIGATVLTQNEEHFSILQTVTGVRYKAELPDIAL